MNSVTTSFDKLAYVDRLKSAGFDDAQARAHADALDAAFRSGVTTKADIHEIQRQFQEVEARLDAKITGSSAKLRIGLIRWLIALQLATLVLVVGAIKFVKPAKHSSDCSPGVSQPVNFF